ncbi:MAG: ATP-binding protein, partial [Thermoplasmata archaeon]
EQRVEGDYRLISSSVREIERVVGGIIGMDRDSFEKLVYVKQKDLDALRNLAKASREAMMNKVMGMEVFDDAMLAAKSDRSQRLKELAFSEADLSKAEEDWKLHEERLQEDEKKDSELKEIQGELKTALKEANNAKREVQICDWLEKEENLERIQISLKEKLSEIDTQLREMESRSVRLKGLEEQLEEIGNPQETESSLRKRIGASENAKQRERDLERARERLQQAKIELEDLKRHKPLAEETLGLISVRESIQGHLSSAQGHEARLEKIESEIREEEERLRLPAAEAGRIQKGLPTRKKRMLIGFGIALLGGLVSLFLGLLLFLPAMLAGVGLLAAAAWMFSAFLQMEKLANRALHVIALVDQRKTIISDLKEARLRLNEALSSGGVTSEEELEEKLERILRQLRELAGLDHPESFDDALRQREHNWKERKGEAERLQKEAKAFLDQVKEEDSVCPVPDGADLQELLEAAKQQVRKKHRIEATKQELEEEVKRSQSKDLPRLRESTKDKLREMEKERGKHMDHRPPEAEGRSYSEEEHRKAASLWEELRERVTNLKNDRSAVEEALRRIEDDLERTREGYESFPSLSQQFDELKLHVEVLQRTAEELRSTAAELREKVLPAARYILNQLLPIITDGRYADLEISDDLQFRAFSPEAGSYKEKDVFSGGTQDQFLIALRLAFTKAILDSRVRADEYSLFLDECISSSDESRKEGIFEVLEALRDTFSQIFIVAHEDISAFVDHHVLLDRGTDGYTMVRAKTWGARD